MRDLSQHRASCAINTVALGFQAPISDAIDEAARPGFGMIAPWRQDVNGCGAADVVMQIRDVGLNLRGYTPSVLTL